MRVLGFLLLGAGLASYFVKESLAGGLATLPFIAVGLGLALIVLGTFGAIGGDTIDMTKTPAAPREMRAEMQENLAAEFVPHQEEAPARSGGSRQEQSAQALDEVVDLLRKNQKIEAIKVLREATGLGLKEAKDAVEILERRLRS